VNGLSYCDHVSGVNAVSVPLYVLPIVTVPVVWIEHLHLQLQGPSELFGEEGTQHLPNSFTCRCEATYANFNMPNSSIHASCDSRGKRRVSGIAVQHGR